MDRLRHPTKAKKGEGLKQVAEEGSEKEVR